ncbi:MAG: Unknown protein [uncultured Sulfurovum sp.]|uniref:SPOR domain-containing protein n=1 Tax=uncultured Sulfurovum sp. TaxID=269237 RepID=A0A6S6SQ25_9BACT|nr:MAG: Unknown protein [uncultured Sulfurovum sp.]
MIRLLVLLMFLLHLSHASSKKYFIQFGSFKNLKGLEQSIEQLPSALRSHVVIVRSNSWYIPFAYYTSNKQALASKLPLYKRYFRDAGIRSSSYMLNHPLVRNYATQIGKDLAPKRRYIPPVREDKKAFVQPRSSMRRVVVPQYQNVAISEEDNTLTHIQPLAPIRAMAPKVERVVTQKIVRKQVEDDLFVDTKPKKHKTFSKKMLSGQYYYLAYKSKGMKEHLLIKVSFGNHQVTYQPVIGEMKMTKANYMTEGGKLYMFADTFTRNGSFSTLDEHRSNHFLVSSWAKGKQLNTLRYYYKMNDAKAYLGLGTSDGLAEILSEGDYDDFFLDE